MPVSPLALSEAMNTAASDSSASVDNRRAWVRAASRSWNCWDAEIRARLRATLRGSDLPYWPSRQWLAESGGDDLLAAVDRSGGARRWASELGIPLCHLRGQRWTPELIAAAVEPLIQAHMEVISVP